MSQPRYRVVLTGELLPGVSREAALAALARIFETSAAELAPVIDGGGQAVEDPLDAHAASALQKRLERIGLRTRIESAGGAPPRAVAGRLRLPVREGPAEAGLMHCPACGHAQLVAKRCDECGVVFAEYNRQRRADVFLQPIPAPPGRPAGAADAGPVEAGPAKSPPRDFHAAANTEWHQGWLDENEVPTERYHLNLFVGAGSADLAEACGKLTLGSRTRWRPTWTGGAVFSPFLWAMYRKMWAWSVLIFVVEILLPVLLITLGAKPNVPDRLVWVGLGLIIANRLFWPAIMKSLYCRHARRTILYMHRLAPTYASDIDIATRGGTSRTSAFAGLTLALALSLLAWNVTDSLHRRLAAPPPVLAGVPEAPPPQAPPPAVTDPRDLALVNENQWVATRNRLRTLGQAISSWLAGPGSTRDPARLELSDIARAIPLDAAGLSDAWGGKIMYQFEGEGYRLISAGPDGLFGNSDDVEYRRILER